MINFHEFAETLYKVQRANREALLPPVDAVVVSPDLRESILIEAGHRGLRGVSEMWGVPILVDETLDTDWRLVSYHSFRMARGTGIVSYADPTYILNAPKDSK